MLLPVHLSFRSLTVLALIVSTFSSQVTLIKNLEVYGLDPGVVATALQHRVQASSVLQPVPGSKDKVLVQIQGNQIHQAGNLLLGLNLNIIQSIFQTVVYFCTTKLTLSYLYLVHFFQIIIKFLVSTYKDWKRLQKVERRSNISTSMLSTYDLLSLKLLHCNTTKTNYLCNKVD